MVYTGRTTAFQAVSIRPISGQKALFGSPEAGDGLGSRGSVVIEENSHPLAGDPSLEGAERL
jgi:hypothetical protein